MKQIYYLKELVGIWNNHLTKTPTIQFLLFAKLLACFIEGFITLKQINTMKSWARVLRHLP